MLFPRRQAKASRSSFAEMADALDKIPKEEPAKHRRGTWKPRHGEIGSRTRIKPGRLEATEDGHRSRKFREKIG